MVSASHNPIAENGIKVFDHQGVKLSDQIQDYIESLFFGGYPLPYQIRPALGTYEADYAWQYARSLAREYQNHEWRKRRVVIDCAHGAAYLVGPLTLGELGISHAALNISPDGTNINLQAGSEYVRLNPGRLAQEMRWYGAEIGIAVDGDADRLTSCGSSWSSV